MARNALKNISRMLDAVDKSCRPEEAFLLDLKRSIETTAAKDSGKPSQTYKPSSMKCIRDMYFQVTGAVPDSAPRQFTNIGICNSGTDIHVRVQNAVSDMCNNGIDCEYVDVEQFVKERGIKNLEIRSKNAGGTETKLYDPKRNLSFMCDGIIRYRNVYYILELKTEASFKFQTRSDVNPEHFAQGTAYSLEFGLNDVLFVYINRDNLDMKSFMLHVTDDMKQELEWKIMQCDDYVNKGEVPPLPEEASPKFCRYCGYATLCDSMKKGE